VGARTTTEHATPQDQETEQVYLLHTATADVEAPDLDPDPDPDLDLARPLFRAFP
jgi:hypothetical protein